MSSICAIYAQMSDLDDNEAIRCNGRIRQLFRGGPTA